MKTGSGVLLVNPPEDDMISYLCDWAGGSMKSQELEAMWLTWEDWIDEGSWKGDTLLVFPLPPEAVSNISSIYLQTDRYMYVEYSRFFLGIISR